MNNKLITYEDFSLSENIFLGKFRLWLINQKKTYLYSNKPIWMELIKWKQWSSLDELLFNTQNNLKNDILLNKRDNKNRGWLHYCIYNNVPDILSIKGFYLLNHSWNNEDIYLNEPLFIFPNDSLANEMAKRLWIEKKSYNKKELHDIFNQLYKESILNKKYSLSRIWLQWLKYT